MMYRVLNFVEIELKLCAAIKRHIASRPPVVATNHLQRQFTVDWANQVRVTETIYSVPGIEGEN